MNIQSRESSSTKLLKYCQTPGIAFFSTGENVFKYVVVNRGFSNTGDHVCGVTTK